MISAADADYPEGLRSLSLEEIGFSSLEDPYTVLNVSDPRVLALTPEIRDYLKRLGIKTVLLIPLLSQGQVNGLLGFRFVEERDFEAEELEIARALATQASLAIHLAELATSAKQSAVLEERNRLAGEIHDSLAQSFTGITMQLEMAKEAITQKVKDNGIGITSVAEIREGFGFANMRARVKKLKGTLNIRTAPGRGTSIIVRVPVKG